LTLELATDIRDNARLETPVKRWLLRLWFTLSKAAPCFYPTALAMVR
jgi:hypothetical protein